MLHEKHITLSELLADVRRTLAERFPLGVWICAEIGEIKENRYSGHCYLELIEKGDKEGTPKAKASAAIWRSKWGAIDGYFFAATGTRLAAGMSVLLKVGVTFHEAYGLLLVVSDIDPTYTLGESERQRRATIEALKADGVIELNKQLPQPPFFGRVAVISSATAAGLQDFSNHLAESPYLINHTLFEAIMQGSAAEESIIAALEAIAEREQEFDCVAIIRGGGAQSDLGCFNSYALCSIIAQFPLPVLTGIGHDKDNSVADLVAAASLKTPTALADYLSQRIEGYLWEVEELYERITRRATTLIADHSNRLMLYGAKLQSSSQRLLGNLSLHLDRATMRLQHSAERTLAEAHSRLTTASAQVASASPERILSLGFALVRHKGKSVSDTTLLHEGDSIEVMLSNGSVEATVTKSKQK